MRYRKRPVEVEAMRIDTEYQPDDFLDPNTRSVAMASGWMLGHGFKDFRVHGDRHPHGIAIHTLEGVMVAAPGDWIIRGVHGEFYPVKPDLFEATYEPVGDEP